MECNVLPWQVSLHIIRSVTLPPARTAEYCDCLMCVGGGGERGGLRCGRRSICHPLHGRPGRTCRQSCLSQGRTICREGQLPTFQTCSLLPLYPLYIAAKADGNCPNLKVHGGIEFEAGGGACLSQSRLPPGAWLYALWPANTDSLSVLPLLQHCTWHWPRLPRCKVSGSLKPKDSRKITFSSHQGQLYTLKRGEIPLPLRLFPIAALQRALAPPTASVWWAFAANIHLQGVSGGGGHD